MSRNQRNKRTRRERERLTQKRAATSPPSRPFSGSVDLTAADLDTAADISRAWSTQDDTAERTTATYSEREADAVDEARACLRLCRGADPTDQEQMARTALDALRLAVRLDDADEWLRSAA